MATLSSVFAWKILWTEEPGGYTAHVVAKSPKSLSMHISSKFVNFIFSKNHLLVLLVFSTIFFFFLVSILFILALIFVISLAEFH